MTFGRLRHPLSIKAVVAQPNVMESFPAPRPNEMRARSPSTTERNAVYNLSTAERFVSKLFAKAKP